MTGRSSCPECGTILRIRDRTFVGRRVSCPACKVSLKVEATDDKGDYVVHRASDRAQPTSTQPELQFPVDSKSKKVPLKASINRLFYSPLTAAWLLAIAVSALVAVMTLSPKFRFARGKPVPPPARIETKPSEESQPATMEPAAIAEEAAPLMPPVVEIPPETPLEQLVAISALEPANVDGPLPILPPPAMSEEKPEPPPPAKKNIPGMMAQPITRYTQPKISRRVLLETLAEQLGAPIKYDQQDLGTDSLDDTVSFELVETTIGDVIKKVTDGAGWDIITEDTGIRLERKRSSVNQ